MSEVLKPHERLLHAGNYIAGGLASLSIGLLYITEHTAPVQSLVMSTRIGERMIAVDASEALVGGIALTAAGIMFGRALSVAEEIRESNNS